MDIAEITRLPLHDKITIMETLWADFSPKLDAEEISDEQKAELDHRLAQIESGTTKVHDWDSVKHSIGKR